jgi:hypothetical protein
MVTPVYCTVDDVAKVLGFPAGTFTATSKPDSATVEAFINMAEDAIDHITGHAWRERWNYGRPVSEDPTGVTNKFEEHEIGRLGVRQSWFTWRGYQLHLNRRRVKQLDPTKDVFQVREAGNWVNWLPFEGTRFEVDYDHGIVWIFTLFLGTRRGFYARLERDGGFCLRERII